MGTGKLAFHELGSETEGLAIISSDGKAFFADDIILRVLRRHQCSPQKFLEKATSPNRRSAAQKNFRKITSEIIQAAREDSRFGKTAILAVYEPGTMTFSDPFTGRRITYIKSAVLQGGRIKKLSRNAA